MNRILEETEPHDATSTVSSYLIETSPDGNERKEAYKWSIAYNPLSGYVMWSHETGTVILQQHLKRTALFSIFTPKIQVCLAKGIFSLFL